MEGEIDILVCTTIIETGVDVPNANTLIIENAENHGVCEDYVKIIITDQSIDIAKQTVLRKLFSIIGVKYSSRKGGYTRIYRLPPRRGDASEMALIQLV